MRTVEPTLTDWRLPENRREAFQRSYTFSLEFLNFPGMVYAMLPAIAEHFDLDEDGRAWLAWLNGNTQNAVTSFLLLEAAPHPKDWRKAVDFWNTHFKALEWDTDRRHQKAKFGEATEQWIAQLADGGDTPFTAWSSISGSWRDCWNLAFNSPYMGRISAWSYMEFAKILLPFIPDVESWFLEASSSRSHRNALSLLYGFEGAWGWDRNQAELPALLIGYEPLEELAEDLLSEAKQRNAGDPNVTRLTMESALCTFKSWHKPNRRYPNVYADMMYKRIRKAEARMNRKLDLMWEIRRNTLPEYLRLEDKPYDPGLCPAKQNHYRETGEIPLLCTLFEDMPLTEFDRKVATGAFGVRKEPTWT